jgi:EF hand
MRRVLLVFLLAALLAASSVARADESTLGEGDPRAAFADTDRNGDGQVDPEEFNARMIETFFFADEDKDGYLVVAEYAVLGLPPEDFQRSDANRDGRLGLYEFVDTMDEVFDRADTNSDGTLSLEEVETESSK